MCSYVRLRKYVEALRLRALELTMIDKGAGIDNDRCIDRLCIDMHHYIPILI